MIKIKFQWLNTLLSIDDEIESLKVQIKINQLELNRWSNRSDGQDGDLAKRQTFLIAIEKQKHIKQVIDTLNEREKKLQKQREEIIELIDKFKGLDQEILKLKYVEGLTLEAIADELSYDYQYIKNKHAKIMKMIRFAKESK